MRHPPIQSSVCVDGASYALDFVHFGDGGGEGEISPSKEDMRSDMVT